MYKVYFWDSHVGIWFFEEDFNKRRQPFRIVDVDTLDKKDLLRLESSIYSCIRVANFYNSRGTSEENSLRLNYMLELARYVFQLTDKLI